MILGIRACRRIISGPPCARETTKITAAKWLCGQCLVRRTCLDAALEGGDTHGIRGGMTEEEHSRADFDALVAIPDGTTYPSVEQGLAALGFDGAFAGTYLD